MFYDKLKLYLLENQIKKKFMQAKSTRVNRCFSPTRTPTLINIRYLIFKIKPF